MLWSKVCWRVRDDNHEWKKLFLREKKKSECLILSSVDKVFESSYSLLVYAREYVYVCVCEDLSLLQTTKLCP